MKKKVLLFLVVVSALVCLLAISVSAADMPNYCTVKLTLTNGEVVTAYCSTSSNQMQRDNLYKTPDSAGEKYSWEDVVIFDCRDQEIVGTNFPRAFSGTGCNSQAKNVTTVYLSDYFTYFLNSTFTSGWASLETVYISKTVTELKGFAGSPVKTVVIPEDSAITTLGGDAFSSCKNLENIDISKCQNLKTIGSNAFRSCEALTSIVFPDGLETIGYNGFYLAGIGGTVVVPNSVKKLDSGSFLATKIETLVMGDGLVEVGFNFMGVTNNAYLKNVYLSAETVFLNTNTFYRCANPVNFYITGDNCETVVASLLGQQSSNTHMKFILAEEATDEIGAGYGIIHTGYSRCEAFYGGDHDSYAIAPCLDGCTRCNVTTDGEAEHIYVPNATFAGERYMSECTVTKVCSECQNNGEKTNIGAMIISLGYSVPEKPFVEGTTSISQGFYLDLVGISAYEIEMGEKLEYGVVAANGQNGEPIVIFEGVANANGISIVVPMVGNDCFEIKIGGISSSNFDTAVVFNAYVVENETVYYISGEKTSTTPVALSYNQIK